MSVYLPESMQKLYARRRSEAAQLSRRGFIKLTGLAGGGFALALSLGPTVEKASAQAASGAEQTLNPYVQIRADGKIVLFAKNPEVGQGVKTALPLLVAEELDADWQAVEVRQSAISQELYGLQLAGGSTSIPMNFDALRRAERPECSAGAGAGGDGPSGSWDIRLEAQGHLARQEALDVQHHDELSLPARRHGHGPAADAEEALREEEEREGEGEGPSEGGEGTGARAARRLRFTRRVCVVHAEPVVKGEHLLDVDVLLHVILRLDDELRLDFLGVKVDSVTENDESVWHSSRHRLRARISQ
jgi:hypothetical protein